MAGNHLVLTVKIPSISIGMEAAALSPNPFKISTTN
jgi:hypothetical protein